MSLYLVIMGVQGAGKGTQAAVIQKTFGIPHVSTGDLFRAMKSRTDELAQRVQDIMRSGALVPDDVTSEVLKDRLEQPDAAGGVILDGYPRNPAQAEWLETYLASKGDSVKAVLLLNLDLYMAFKRAFGRVSSADKTQYNIYTHNDGLEWRTVEHPDKTFPPRLEVIHKPTGEVLNRRPDDEAFSVIKRIDTYVESTQPLVEYYRGKGVLVEVMADQPIDAVSQSIKDAIDRVK